MAKVGWAARDGRGVGTVVSVPRPRKGRTSDEVAHPCASCGACCRTYIVPLCGRDVWRISRRLFLEPEQFVVAWREEEDGPDRFRLEPEGPRYSLVLDRRAWLRDRSPCVFLLSLPGGQERCGVYEHRPVACGAYPMVLRRDAVALRDDPLCPPDAWPPDEPSRPGWGSALRRARMEFDVYHAVVQRWNAGGRSTAAAHHPSDYFRFLLAVYDELAALEDGLGETAMAALRASWRAPGEVALAPGGWSAHMELVRAVAGRH